MCRLREFILQFFWPYYKPGQVLKFSWGKFGNSILADLKVHEIMNKRILEVDPKRIKMTERYWVTQKLPQLYTAYRATFPIRILKITVQLCGNFWVAQYNQHTLIVFTLQSPRSSIILIQLGCTICFPISVIEILSGPNPLIYQLWPNLILILH